MIENGKARFSFRDGTMFKGRRVEGARTCFFTYILKCLFLRENMSEREKEREREKRERCGHLLNYLLIKFKYETFSLIFPTVSHMTIFRIIIKIQIKRIYVHRYIYNFFELTWYEWLQHMFEYVLKFLGTFFKDFRKQSKFFTKLLIELSSHLIEVIASNFE